MKFLTVIADSEFMGFYNLLASGNNTFGQQVKCEITDICSYLQGLKGVLNVVFIFAASYYICIYSYSCVSVAQSV
jgi:hypothetical protein